MSRVKPKTNTKPVVEEEVDTVQVESTTEEVVVETVVEKTETVEPIIEPVKKAKAAPTKTPEEKTITITAKRDEQGRLVFEGEGIGKRIAGTDTVIPEVARQIGEEIVNRRLI